MNPAEGFNFRLDDETLSGIFGARSVGQTSLEQP